MDEAARKGLLRAGAEVITWRSETPPEPVVVTPGGWALIALRGPVLAIWIFGGLVLLLALRIVERPLAGLDRPATSRVTRTVCRGALAILGIPLRVEGQVDQSSAAMVANHSSWLDIFALNAVSPVYFVSKAEVASWPGIGWLARATGTLFIRRHRRDAMAQQHLMRTRLAAGHRLLFFPEGTSTDGLRVLPFKSTLFGAFFAQGDSLDLVVQPLSVIYTAPPGRDLRFYGWWGDMGFAAHLLNVMATRKQGPILVRYHPPLRAAAFGDRKSLARAAECAVRDGVEDGLQRRAKRREP